MIASVLPKMINLSEWPQGHNCEARKNLEEKLMDLRNLR